MASMQKAEHTNKEVDFPIRLMMDELSESLQKEKQIVVDPLSLKESSNITITTSSTTNILHPPPLQPPKLKFLSLSLPNSPRFTNTSLSKKKSKGDDSRSPESQLRKSKSCDERGSFATSDELLDQWLSKLSAIDQHDSNSPRLRHLNVLSALGTPRSPRHHEANVKESHKNMKKRMQLQNQEDGFKCSALCLYLPGFGGKVKAIRKEESQRGGVMSVMSRTVSLENFECGSWSSAAIFNDVEGDSNNLYFDLPMELIKCGGANELHSPVSASFVFEKDLKGILKSGNSRGTGAGKSDASPRHVRFSVTSSSSSYPSSPASCISPRLRKAREDFNAFLAAQSA